MGNDGQPNDTDFESAFMSEMGVESTPPATDDVPPAPSDDTPPASDDDTPPASDDTPPAVDDTPPSSDDDDDDTPNDDAPKDDEPKYATPDDVKQAMRDYHQETQQRADQLSTVASEIISTLHPQGIDDKIYDTDGNVIKTAQDIVDRGLLKENGEPYTYEEAASFMLEAGRQRAANMNELRNWAENVAEQNISLVEGNQRVMEQWGDILKDPQFKDLADELATEYIRTQLEFDNTNSYITKMNMSPETYYNRVLSPYRELIQARAAQEAANAEAQAQAQKDKQNERNGLPPQRGAAKSKPNSGDPMLDALLEELGS